MFEFAFAFACGAVAAVCFPYVYKFVKYAVSKVVGVFKPY